MRSLDVLTYDGERFTVGKTSDVGAGSRSSPPAAGARRSTPACAPSASATAPRCALRYPHIPRRVSGYNLDALLEENGFDVAQALVGTEGTCVVVLEATLTLIDARPARSLVVLGYPDVATAADHVPQIMEYRPVGLEGLDDELIGFMQKKGMRRDDLSHAARRAAAGCWSSSARDTAADADAQARRMMAELRASPGAPAMRLFDDKQQEQKLWEVREAGLGATAHVPGMAPTHPGWEDSAVPPGRLGSYLRGFRKLLDEFGYHAALYGHFGQGCLHCRIDFDLATAAGVTRWKAFLQRAADLVVAHGGSLSGEHGDGQARAWLLPKMFGDDLVRAFGEFKRLWDPAGKMNPGKLVDAFAPDQNLRTGPDDEPRVLETHFAFANDGGSFARAAARCVGVGACRRVEGGVMCPELHGHARGGGLHARAGAPALRDDPRRRDFRRLARPPRPRGAGPVPGVQGLPQRLPGQRRHGDLQGRVSLALLRRAVAAARGVFHGAHSLVGAPGVADGARGELLRAHLAVLVGVEVARGRVAEASLPRFATTTFRRWFARRRPHALPGARRVLLWPDTFSNYLMTDAARAAVEVLESAGYAVEIPVRPLCCGRPLYDWGMLPTAKKVWQRTLDGLRPYIRDGVPIVGLEPSCVAAFRDELVGLLPKDEDAQRLAKQTFMLGEFLENEGYTPPRLHRRALVQGHCHHKAVIGMQGDTRLLDKLGLEYEVLDAGCCGMAGSFGFEADHYDISIAAGERLLLPAVRAADAETLIIADGFSCREQILQTTSRRPLHLAEVLQLALRESANAHERAEHER